MNDIRISFTAAGEVALLDDGRIPDLPAGGVRIRNLRTAVSPGTELACLAGLESSWFPFPGVPGYCAVGVIEAVGAGVTAWAAGDTVLHYGGHRLWQIAVPGKDFLCRVPDEVPVEQAPFARMATIAITALRQSAIELGDDVAVTGLGLIGNLAAQLAALQGANVVAFDIDASRVALAQACAVRTALAGGPQQQTEAARTATGTRGFSTLIEATGRAATVAETLPLMARRGEVLLLGTPRATHSCDLAAVLRQFHLADRALVLKPAHEWIRPVEEDAFSKHSFARDTRIALALIASGRLRIAPLITHRLRPEQAPAAYRELAAGRPGYAGVVIDWSSIAPSPIQRRQPARATVAQEN